MRKNSAALIAAALSFCACTGCSLSGGTDFDAAAYVKGVLDCAYLGDYAGYTEMTGIPEEEAVQSYETGLEAEAGAFASYFGFSDYFHSAGMDDQLRTALTDFYREAYSHASYTVNDAIQTKNGYTVEVTVRPLDLFSGAAAELEAYLAEIQGELDSGAFDEGGSDSFYAAYISGVLDVCQPYAASPAYGEDVTLVLQVEKDGDGQYAIRDTDFQKLDAEMICYS